MTNFIYKLQIAGAVFEIRMPVKLEPGKSCIPFLTEQNPADILLDYRFGEPEDYGEVCIRKVDPTVWRGEDYFRVERAAPMEAVPYTSVYLNDRNHKLVHGLIYPSANNKLTTIENILHISELEILFSSLDAISLHSSLIRHERKSILFTAPSGTGKSTQAELWRIHRSAEILNGDRAIVRNIDGCWTGFGSPFSGSSGIYCNQAAPIRAIVILRQGKEDKIIRIKPAEAFRALYAETVIPRWNDMVHKHILNLLMNITNEVPIVLLRCRPERSAVELLDDYLRGGAE